MKIFVKKVPGNECSIDVSPTTSISEIKIKVADKFNIPVNKQMLMHLGRPLADDTTLQSYPAIKEGTKLYLIVKKPESLFEASVKLFKKSGMTEVEACNTAKRLLQVVQEKFNKYSLDDVERLAADCLLSEKNESSGTDNMK